MANRYPLVIDTSDNNRLKEIPNGDNLLLTGNSITGVINITASGTVTANDVIVSGNITYQGNVLNNIATSGAYSDLTGVPTALSQFTNDIGYLTTVAFNDLTSTPTTLGGYGITDAATSLQGALATTALQAGANISTLNNDSQYVTLPDLQNGVITVDVNNSGDLVGSVFADDSTVMIDSILAAVNLDGTIRGNVVPNANQHNTWDLGNDTVRFKDAYFAGAVKGSIVASTAAAPTANADPGDTGEIRYDDNYLYIKTASGWKRTALSGIV